MIKRMVIKRGGVLVISTNFTHNGVKHRAANVLHPHQHGTLTKDEKGNIIYTCKPTGEPLFKTFNLYSRLIWREHDASIREFTK